MCRHKNRKRSSVGEETHLVHGGHDRVDDFILTSVNGFCLIREIRSSHIWLVHEFPFSATYLERLPHYRAILNSELCTTLAGQYPTGRDAQRVVVQHADDVAILPVTGPLDVGDQFLSQELSNIGTKVTRM